MRKFKLLVLMLIATFALMPTARAITVDDLANADDKLTLNKKLQGTSFAAGNSVDLKGEVDGISFAAGNDVKVSNKSDYSFLAGNSLKIKDIETKDLFIAGNEITIDSSKIKRDVYIAGNIVEINGSIGRNVYTYGKKVIINGTINGNLTINAEEIELGKDATVKETFKYNDNAKIDIKDKSKLNKIKKYKIENAEKESKSKETITGILTSKVISLLNMLLVGFIMLALFKGFFKKIAKEELEAGNIIKNILLGFGIFIVVPIAFLFVLLSTIGVATALIAIAIYILTLYLSSLVTSYFLAKKILDKKIKNDYLVLLIGLAAINVIELIPIIGGLVSALSLFFGIGLFIKVIFKSIKSKKSK